MADEEIRLFDRRPQKFPSLGLRGAWRGDKITSDLDMTLVNDWPVRCALFD